ncbi:MAG: PQQ-dependent sugar dehydrogenase, partial [Acidobacteria bacterium]|nr:PQQ-dependent sugar dehydrogenase [Acidobacteriota bacterium]
MDPLRSTSLLPLLLICVVPGVGLSPAVAAPPPVALEVVATGLDFPVAVTHAADDRVFVTLKGGQVLILEGGVVLPEPFLDLGDQVSTKPADGLLSIVFHPHYAANGFFFVQYVEPSGDTVIARYHVSEDPNLSDPDSAAVLLRFSKPIPSHHGGFLRFGPDGYLWAATGDSGGADDPFCRAQADDSLLGKVLRLDVDHNVDQPPYYAVPLDNPFVGPGAPLDEIWAKG